MLALRSSARHPSELNALDRAILRTSAPLQGALSGGARAVRQAGQRYVFVSGAAHENLRLREENARLRTDLLVAQRRAAREGDLERLLGLQSRIAAETVGASVVGADTNAYFRVARIRLDQGEGTVMPGMAVLAPGGVVGRIARVYGPWSDVLLSIDPRSAIDVVVSRTGAKGILRGAGARDRYRATVELDSSQKAVQVGDELVTSGLGGTFPRDVPVGKVVRVSKHDLGLFAQADVEPVIDFYRLDHVLVLVTPPPPEEPKTEGRPGRVEPAHGVVPYR